MCTFTDSTHTLCGHTHRLTDLCRRQRGGRHALFSSPCNLTLNATYYRSLCHDCHRFFQHRRLPQSAAIGIYRNYREVTGYYGSLTPTTLFNGEIILTRDRVIVLVEDSVEEESDIVLAHSRSELRSAAQQERTRPTLEDYEAELLAYLGGRSDISLASASMRH